MTPEQKPCPRCDGLGTYPYNKHHPDTPYDGQCQCWRCDGTGIMDDRIEAGAARLRDHFNEGQAITIARMVLAAADSVKAQEMATHD